MKAEKINLPLLDIENIIPVLDKISIFAGLTDTQLQKVFKLLQKVSYAKGETIFERGSTPSYIYVIKKGEIKLVAEVEDTPLELMLFSSGQCFGETSVIGIQPHSASAVAVENSDLIVLSREALLSLFDSDKELFSILILNIAREACRRLNKTDEILLHYYMTAKRIAERDY